MGFNVFSKNLLVFYMLNQVIFVVDLFIILACVISPTQTDLIWGPSLSLSTLRWTLIQKKLWGEQIENPSLLFGMHFTSKFSIWGSEVCSTSLKFVGTWNNKGDIVIFRALVMDCLWRLRNIALREGEKVINLEKIF